MQHQLATFALLFTACTAQEAPPEPTTSAALVQPNPGGLAADPRFKPVFDTTYAMTNRIATVFDQATPQHRAELRAQLYGWLEAPSSTMPAAVFELTGKTQSQLLTLGGQIKVLTSQYSISVSAGWGQAAQTAKFNMDYTLHPTGGCVGTRCDCASECEEDYRAAHNNNGLQLAIDLAGANIFGFVDALADFVAAENEAADDLIDCQIRCAGGDPQCNDDSDCPDDKFCGHGLGNPYNSCRAKKPEGEVCSGDRKCASDCCKYNLFANPFSMVCRPADKCN